MSHKQPVQVSNNGALNGHSPAVQRDPEVVPKAKRRTFSAEYKLRIFAEAETTAKARELADWIFWTAPTLQGCR